MLSTLEILRHANTQDPERPNSKSSTMLCWYKVQISMAFQIYVLRLGCPVTAFLNAREQLHSYSSGCKPAGTITQDVDVRAISSVKRAISFICLRPLCQKSFSHSWPDCWLHLSGTQTFCRLLPIADIFLPSFSANLGRLTQLQLSVTSQCQVSVN